MRLHTSTNRYTLRTTNMKGNVTEPLCIIHISNPCETVHYACKFYLSTNWWILLCVFNLLQLNVNHYVVYSSFQRNTREFFSTTQSCRLWLAWHEDSSDWINSQWKCDNNICRVAGDCKGFAASKYSYSYLFNHCDVWIYGCLVALPIVVQFRKPVTGIHCKHLIIYWALEVISVKEKNDFSF